jgi:chromate transporter
MTSDVALSRILREWGRIGCIGFGGPPTHIALLRELCVRRRQWLGEEDFEDAIAACNLLPGPASTQLAIYCAWRLRGRIGAVVGGLAFIVPGLLLIIALAAVFLAAAPPRWVLGAGAGAGAAVAAVAVHAGLSLVPSSWARAAARSRVRWIVYVGAGGAAAATIGPWLVLVLLGCGAVELLLQRTTWMPGIPVVATVGATGGLLSLVWVAFKVGALS